MKRTIWLGLGLAVVVGGAWFGRAAWRAHKNLVSLDVRNMPLREVVRNIEWQTWEKIHLDKRLDGQVTLKLKNTTLAEALDRLAEEVSARAQTLYAVHRSDYALKRLKTALQNGEKIGSVGWTNLAPRQAAGGITGDLPNLDDLLKQGHAQISSGGAPGAKTLSLKLGPDGKLTRTDGGKLSGTNLPGFARGQVNMSPPIVSVMKAGPDGTLEEVEPGILSPERIVIETVLDEQFANDLPANPTREAAEQAARKAKGRCTTLYALEKSDFPVMFARALKGPPGGVLSSDPDGASLDPAAMADRVVQEMRREKAEQYRKLTPEQRARRARDLRALSGPANTNP